MKKDNNIRYVVAIKDCGIWYTLLTDNRPHVFFPRSPKSYTYLSCACSAANKLFNQCYGNEVRVFKINVGDTLSCTYYKKAIEDGKSVYSVKRHNDGRIEVI